MNRLVLFVGFIAIIGLLLSCSCEDCNGEDGSYPTQATIYFINETSDSIVSEKVCERDIAPSDTLTLEISRTLCCKHDINDFSTSIFICSRMMYKDGSALKCESKVEDIKNYENRKEVAPRVFEFTFRFTEEKKAKAESCL